MTRRLKRLAAPRTWPIPRKGTKWVLRTAPGPHAQEESIPVETVLRDVLHLASTAREVRILLNEKKVMIDGTVVKDPARGLGLMDVLSLGAPLSKHYRVLKSHLGKLYLLPIEASEAASKLARVRFKSTVPGGKVALTLHDGRNLLVEAKSEYRTGDTLQLHVPDQKVVARLPLAPDMLVYISGGAHVGEMARVERVEVIAASQANRVHFKEGFSTIRDYAFVVGDKAPAVTLSEVVG